MMFSYNPLLNVLMVTGAFVTKNDITASDIIGYVPDSIPKPSSDKRLNIALLGYDSSGLNSRIRSLVLQSNGGLHFESIQPSGITFVAQFIYITTDWFD